MSYSRLTALALCVAASACIHTNGPATAPVSQHQASGHTGPVATVVVGAPVSSTGGRTFLHPESTSTEPKVTVTYQDSDIRNVFAALATFSGRTIIVRSQVQGTVSLEIHDQPWDVAMQSILDQERLAASVDQYGIITVAPVARESGRSGS